VDVALHLAASADSMVSGAVEEAPLTMRIARRDFRLSRNDAAGQASARGVVSGVVSGEGGRPIAGALIQVDGAEEVRSGEDGRFIVRDVAAGTRQLEVRAIGAAPQTTIVDVAPNDTTELGLSLGKVQTLETVNVKATSFRQLMVRNIEERRLQGLGYFRDSSDFGKMANMAQAVDGIAGLRVIRLRGSSFRLAARPPCGERVAIWIDRIRLDESVLSSLRPDEIATIEVFQGSTTTPPEFMARGMCGALVVWTKRFLRS
jgi:hypothetical protein